MKEHLINYGVGICAVCMGISLFYKDFPILFFVGLVGGLIFGVLSLQSNGKR
jgi:hypothetical protein